MIGCDFFEVLNIQKTKEFAAGLEPRGYMSMPAL